MLNVVIKNEKLCKTAQQLGQRANFQKTIEETLKLYVEYLKQQEIIQGFGTIDFNHRFFCYAQLRIVTIFTTFTMDKD